MSKLRPSYVAWHSVRRRSSTHDYAVFFHFFSTFNPKFVSPWCWRCYTVIPPVVKPGKMLSSSMQHTVSMQMQGKRPLMLVNPLNKFFAEWKKIHFCFSAAAKSSPTERSQHRILGRVAFPKRGGRGFYWVGISFRARSSGMLNNQPSRGLWNCRN